ncbi:DUF1847 domain-containing protein [Geobacter pickeringii]|uniref:Metal-binding protein n=1 Tax=Geobacter pickeringii TaxID=345632 RepID=A0A0B5B6D7_9BACT|nr:DUF1847 domain-containing protein [Geobacter pickeringii]AJE02093.1 hypothetical protein GPICK_00710 [Geobacter pickeringii]
MAHDETHPSCANCSAVWGKSGATNCWSTAENRPPRPANCPTKAHGDIIEASFTEYRAEESGDARLARMAAKVEGLCYQKMPGSEAVVARWTRVEDTVALAKLMGWRSIGIATCIGLLEETRQLAAILEAQGLEPASVCCKSGSIDKLELGLVENDKVRPGTFEPACNPIAQAEILNRIGTDMNIIVGLCVGHDMLFTKHSNAPVTTLICKDRVTGHNPAAVLYGQNFYFKRLQKQPVVAPGGEE